MEFGMILSIFVIVVGFLGGIGVAVWLHLSYEAEPPVDTRKISNEDLANELRAMKATGICPSRNEMEILDEAADRLERIDEDEIRAMARKLNVKIGEKNDIDTNANI